MKNEKLDAAVEAANRGADSYTCGRILDDFAVEVAVNGVDVGVLVDAEIKGSCSVALLVNEKCVAVESFHDYNRKKDQVGFRPMLGFLSEAAKHGVITVDNRMVVAIPAEVLT